MSTTDYGPGRVGDPNPQYLTQDEAEELFGTGGAVDEGIAEHVAEENPHPGYLTDIEIAEAITSHEEADDPHTGYETTAGATAKVSAHAALSNPHPTYETSTEAQAKVDAHAAEVNPHATYETSAEAQAKVDTHSSDTTSVHGITDTTLVETTTGATTKVTTHAGAVDPHGDRAYADSVASGLDIKASVRAATTADITLSGAQTIDGVSVIATNRVLVKNQSTTKDNGIYVAAAGAWARATDADTTGEVTQGLFTYVEEGTTLGTSSWVCTSAGTLNTDPVLFTQFNSAGAISGGIALTKTGSTLDVDLGSTPSTQAFGDAAAGGSAETVSKNDHKHAWPALGTTAAAVGTSAGGAAATPSKSDHVHATGAGTPVTQAFGDAAAIGAGPAASMTNHVHGMPANPVTGHLTDEPHYSFGPVYKVEDYDAVGDGIVDDTDAIQACIDAVPDTGGIVAFEPGKQYLLTADTAPITGATYGSDLVVFTLDNFPNIYIQNDMVNVRGIVSTGGDTADGGTYNGLWMVKTKSNTTITCWADGIKDPGTYSSGGVATGGALYLRDKGGVTFQGLGARTQQASAGGSTLLVGTAGMICLTAQKTTTGNITHSGPTFRDLGFEDPNFDVNLTTGAPVAWSSPDGGTFTWTQAGHGFSTGDIVFAGQASNGDEEYEGVYTVTVDSSSSFRATGVGADPATGAATTNIAYQIVPEATAATAVGVVIAGTTRYYAERLNFQGLQQAFALATWASRDCSWGTLQACVWNQCKVGFKIWGDGGQSVNINTGNLIMHTGQVGFQGPEPESTKDMSHFRATGLKLDVQHSSGANCIGFDLKNAKFFYIGHHTFEIEGDSTTRAVRVGKDSHGSIVGLTVQHNVFGGVNYQSTAIEIAGTNAGNSPQVAVFGGDYTNLETAIYIGPFAKGCQVFGGHHHTPGGSGQYGIRVDNASDVIGTVIVGFTSDTESSSVTLLDIPAGSDTKYDMCWTYDDGNPTWFTNQDPTAGQLTLSGASTTSTATGSITGLAITNSVWRWNGASAATLYGIASGAAGRVVILHNASTSQTLTIANNSATETTSTNRIHTGEQADITVGPTSSAILAYEVSSDRWRLIRPSTYSSAAAAIGTASAGTAGLSASRGNHVHATGAGTPSTQAFGDAAAVGSGPAAAMTDHKHAMPTSTTGPDADVTIDAAGAAGTASTAARSGHGHKVATYSSAAAATTTTSGTAGTSTVAPARGDHTHQIGAHGAAEHTNITRTVYRAASDFTVDGGSLSSVGSVPDSIRRLSMNAAGNNGGFTNIQVPDDAVAASALAMTVYWIDASTEITKGMGWSVDAKALNTGVDVSAAGTTTTPSVQNFSPTANQLVTESLGTILSSVSAGDIIRMNIRRNAAGETITGTVSIIGVMFSYSANQ